LTPQIIFFQFGPPKPKSWLRPNSGAFLFLNLYYFLEG
jgi:hypothetical protein